MINSLTGLLLRVLRANPGPGELRGMTYLVIRRPFAHLEEELQRSFEKQGDVRVVVDKRHEERRMAQRPQPAERRHADRRRAKDELMDVVIVNGVP